MFCTPTDTHIDTREVFQSHPNGLLTSRSGNALHSCLDMCRLYMKISHIVTTHFPLALVGFAIKNVVCETSSSLGHFVNFFIALKFCQKTCTYILALYNFFFFFPGCFDKSVSHQKIAFRRKSERGKSLRLTHFSRMLSFRLDPTSADADLFSGHALEICCVVC